MPKDAFDVAAVAAVHVIEGEKSSLTEAVSRELNSPEMTNGGYMNALNAVEALDDVLDGMHAPYEQRKDVRDWSKHYLGRDDDETVTTARMVGQRLQQEYVGKNVADGLKQRDAAMPKQALPKPKTVAPDTSLRAALNKAVKQTGY